MDDTHTCKANTRTQRDDTASGPAACRVVRPGTRVVRLGTRVVRSRAGTAWGKICGVRVRGRRRGPMAVLVVAAAVLGLLVGSFLNVVIHRVPRGESVVRPPSRCPDCGQGIRARHNVPVFGWLVLRGRCAGCGGRISVRYPLVELGTGVLFALLALRFAPPDLPAFLYFGAIGIALALIDLDCRRLPNAIVLP